LFALCATFSAHFFGLHEIILIAIVDETIHDPHNIFPIFQSRSSLGSKHSEIASSYTLPLGWLRTELENPNSVVLLMLLPCHKFERNWKVPSSDSLE
jgi:hypothetical protein